MTVYSKYKNSNLICVCVTGSALSGGSYSDYNCNEINFSNLNDLCKFESLLENRFCGTGYINKNLWAYYLDNFGGMKK